MDFNSEDLYLVQAERAAKQNFLREEILDNGFDAHEFTDFINNKRGANIDIWSFDELKDIVSQFKLHLKHQSEQPKKFKSQLEDIPSPNQFNLDSHPPQVDDPSSHSSSPEIQIPATETLGESDLTKQLGFDNLSDSDNPADEPEPNTQDDMGIRIDTVYQITALKAHTNELCRAENLEIKIQKYDLHSPEIIPGGYFSSPYALFPIYTCPLSWNVKRRFQDFIWLGKVLSVVYPNIKMPPVPDKNMSKGMTDQDFIKQKVYLQRFMDSIIRTALYLRSPYLVVFLNEVNDKSFQILQKAGNKVVKPTKLHEFWSLNGHLSCDKSYRKDWIDNIHNYFYTISSKKFQLKKMHNTLVKKLRELSVILQTLSSEYGRIEELQALMPNNDASKEMYSQLKQSFSDWSIHEYETSNYIKEQMSMFLKYSYNEANCMREFEKERDAKFNTFIKNETRLRAKKEKLWEGGDITKWGMRAEDAKQDPSVYLSNKEHALNKMLTQETNELRIQRDECAHFNYQMNYETARICRDFRKLECKHYSDFGRLFCEHSTKFHLIWGNLTAFLVGLELDYRMDEEGKEVIYPQTDIAVTS